MFAGAFSVAFTALSLTRAFSVRFDTSGMAIAHQRGTLASALYRRDAAGKTFASLRERPDRVLEVRAASGEVFEIPMRVVNYAILREHLDNMVRLYGENS